jgi:phage terminase large subunit GpA-like protein
MNGAMPAVLHPAPPTIPSPHHPPPAAAGELAERAADIRTLGLPAADRAIRSIAEKARVRRLRSRREFAEQEIVLPSGRFKDQRLKIERNPWLGVWLDAVDSETWRRFDLTGVGQGGKTLGGSALPVMYHLFECRETVIYGAPTIDMAHDKWKQDVLPLIEASRYRDLLPESGRGSRGGTALSIQFKHGPTLRFMTGGGGDKVRAGFTARVAVITETDGLDDAGGTSRETDKVSQIEARTASYDDRARVYLECTLSTEQGRTYRELKEGTDSRLALPCPHCSAWVTPERKHLVGWQDARNVVEAREQATLVCPICGAAWSEEDRAAANRAGKLVHKGQTIERDGTIVGLLPKTLTLGFRFTAINNLLVSMRRVAEEEWSAPRRTDADLAEKKLRQFYWTLPSEPESVTLSEIDVAKICARAIAIPRGRLPADTSRITLGCDVGKWMCHWVLIAWRPGGSPHVADYGVIDCPSASMAEELAITAALRKFREDCGAGWPLLTTGTMRPSLSLFDSGYAESTIVNFCRESGVGYLPTKGFGVEQLGKRKIAHEPGYEVVPQKAGYGLVEINADFWKSFVHARLQTPAGQPGGLTLFHVAAANEHLTFAKHLTGEKKTEQFVAGRGLITKWTNESRKRNHYLDALALACVAGHGVGERVIAQPTNPPPPAAGAAAAQQHEPSPLKTPSRSERESRQERSKHPAAYRKKW